MRALPRCRGEAGSPSTADLVLLCAGLGPLQVCGWTPGLEGEPAPLAWARRLVPERGGRGGASSSVCLSEHLSLSPLSVLRGLPGVSPRGAGGPAAALDGRSLSPPAEGGAEAESSPSHGQQDTHREAGRGPERVEAQGRWQGQWRGRRGVRAGELPTTPQLLQVGCARLVHWSSAGVTGLPLLLCLRMDVARSKQTRSSPSWGLHPV